MQPVRPLGLVSATSLVIANMLGTGVFTTSGFLIADLGSPQWVILAWLAGGAIALLGALSYGSLACAIPESGGEYLFLRRTLHPAAGYVAGWVSMLAGFSAPIAMAAWGFGEYLGAWLPGVPVKLSGSLLILGFAAVHAFDVARGAWVQNLAVAAKLALLAVFVAFAGHVLLAPQEVASAAFVPSAFATSLVWISFSYAGWNAAVYVASEVRDPERNLVRSVVLGTAIVTAVYVVINAIFVLGAPAAAIAGQVAVAQIAARHIGGAALENGVTAIVLLALATSVSAMVMAGPRVCARMADDGLLPALLRSRPGAPRAGIALQLALSLAFLWTNTFELLLGYIGFTLSLSTALTVAGLMRWKLQRPELEVIGWPVVPLAFLVFVAWALVFSLGRLQGGALWGLATIAAGALAWWLQEGRRGAR
jgi:APA family basic amino acid/polyamine antiporter